PSLSWQISFTVGSIMTTLFDDRYCAEEYLELVAISVVTVTIANGSCRFLNYNLHNTRFYR
ncbi:MAG: hypothetical protein ACOYLR_09720, partial [Chlorobium sp.]